MAPDIPLLGAKWFIILALILKRVDIKKGAKCYLLHGFLAFNFWVLFIQRAERLLVVGAISN